MPVHDTPLNPAYISLISSDYTTLNNTLGSHITFELYQPIIVDTNVDTWLKLENFKFTNSMYNVSIYSNVFYFGLASNIYISQSVIIPRSNYDVTSLIVALNLNVGNGFSFTYNSQTLKITVSNAQNFYLYNGSNNILKVIGFSNAVQKSVLNVAISDNIINLIGSQMLYLSLPNLSMNSYGVKRTNKSNVISNIASIPVSAIQGDTQTFTSDLHHKINDQIITFIEVRLSDENGNEVNFNGIDWYLTVSLMFTYKKEYKKPTYLTDVQGDVQPEIQDNSLDIPDNINL
jgi:hypothetical protein